VSGKLSLKAPTANGVTQPELHTQLQKESKGAPHKIMTTYDLSGICTRDRSQPQKQANPNGTEKLQVAVMQQAFV